VVGMWSRRAGAVRGYLRASQAGVVPLRRMKSYRSHVGTRLSIINDPTAPSGDRLRAMEQLESRALGRPKETVEHQAEEDPLRAELLQIPREERRAWLRDLNARSRAVDEEAV
jgi:hypothetical protein